MFMRPRATPWDRRGAATPERLQRTPADGEAGLSRGALGNVAGPGVHASAGAGSREELAAVGHHVDGLRQPTMSSCTRHGLESSRRLPLPLEEGPEGLRPRLGKTCADQSPQMSRTRSLEIIVGPEENRGYIFAPPPKSAGW